MPNWLPYVIPIVTLVIGWFLRILQEKILEKRVSLSHRMDDPAIFSNIPPKTCFQNLHIINKGKLPAKNIRICLDDELLSSHEVLFKPVTDEQFYEEKKESMRILKFERLLPEDKLVISFKSPEPLPNEFLISIKSDEMISKSSKEEKGSQNILINLTALIIILLATVPLSMLFFRSRIVTETVRKEEPAQKLAEIQITTNKTTYSINDKIEINYRVKNTTSEVWRDFRTIMEVPGFKLPYDEKYKEKNFLGPGQVFSEKSVLQIPKDVPPGQYKISLQTDASNLTGDHIYSKEHIFFNIE